MIDWNKVRSAVASDEGLVVVERNDDGTLGAPVVYRQRVPVIVAVPGAPPVHQICVNLNGSLAAAKTALNMLNDQLKQIDAAITKADLLGDTDHTQLSSIRQILLQQIAAGTGQITAIQALLTKYQCGMAHISPPIGPYR